MTDIYSAFLPTGIPEGKGSIYGAPGTTVGTYKRGATGSGDGVHILTGPIYVNGAQPGDVLKVDILGLRPRANPATGKTYGINAAAWWGARARAHRALSPGCPPSAAWRRRRRLPLRRERPAEPWRPDEVRWQVPEQVHERLLDG